MQYTLKPLDRKIKAFHMNKANVKSLKVQTLVLFLYLPHE